ncbi:MAG: phosphatase domain-containing protein [Candidatus Krumholzibacteriia bacterium]
MAAWPRLAYPVRMSDWKRVLIEFVDDVESEFDRLKNRLAYAMGGPEPIKIVPYRGFGTTERLFVHGRVLEDQGIRSPRDDDSIWRNMLATYRRLASHEVPHARLRVSAGGQEQEIEADEEGQFSAWLEPPQRPQQRQEEWRRVDFELIEPRSDKQSGPVRAGTEVLVPSPSARFGVISDIDDTVLKSDATNLLRMARTVFLGNANTRLPFPGAAAFYRALRRGADGGGPNPLFYVSNGPWNLYDLLVDFLRLKEFPDGPVMFLRNWGISDEALSPADKSAQRAHKLRSIESILDAYPDLPFILVGDSGEQDPEIYRDIVEDHGERILAVYVRNIDHDLQRPAAIGELAREIVEHGSTLLLAKTSLAMAEHAVERGWIQPESLADISRETHQDEQEPSTLERLLGADEQPEDAPDVLIEPRDEPASPDS